MSAVHEAILNQPMMTNSEPKVVLVWLRCWRQSASLQHSTVSEIFVWKVSSSNLHAQPRSSAADKIHNYQDITHF